MNQLTQKALKIITLILAMTTITAAQAEQKEVMGDWNVHYIAFGSGFLTPEIAKNYGITRSKYNGVVNISVLKTTTLMRRKRFISKVEPLTLLANLKS